MAKEVVIKSEKEKTTAVAIMAEGSWGAENVDAKDVLIPKILLMQPLSALVAKEEKAKVGDIVNSTRKSVLAVRGTGVEIIPISTYKTWVLFEKPEGGKEKFKAVVPHTPANEAWPLEEVVGKVTIKRDRCLNFFCMVVGDEQLPYLLSFRRTSMNTGKVLSTHFMLSREAKQPPAAKVFKLSSHKVDGEKGTYYVFDLEESRKTTNEELSSAYRWYKELQASTHKVDDSDLGEAETEAQAPVDVNANTRF